LNPGRIATTQLTLTQDYKILTALSQDHNVLIWKLLDIYKWESKVKSQIQKEENTVSFKPLFRIDMNFIISMINKIQFSCLKRKILFPKVAANPSMKKELIVESKPHPGKTFKLSIIPGKGEETTTNMCLDKSFLLALGDDKGFITFYRKQTVVEKWRRLDEFQVEHLAAITELSWHCNDEFLAIGTFFFLK